MILVVNYTPSSMVLFTNVKLGPHCKTKKWKFVVKKRLAFVRTITKIMFRGQVRIVGTCFFFKLGDRFWNRISDKVGNKITNFPIYRTKFKWWKILDVCFRYSKHLLGLFEKAELFDQSQSSSTTRKVTVPKIFSIIKGFKRHAQGPDKFANVKNTNYSQCTISRIIHLERGANFARAYFVKS